jgi:hypothetical protein
MFMLSCGRWARIIACLLLQEDDLTKLAGKFGWAPTDVPTGNTPATAAALPIINFGATYNGEAKGVISNASTLHMYSFNASAGVGTFSCEVAPAWINNYQQTNLNCQLSVFSPTDTVNPLITVNPAGYTTPFGLGTGTVNVNLPGAGT